ncbi:MAG: 2-C-methyl-D-erythritol 2,4-cyclodiphosphate synthase [Endomicrobiia bacterium]
MTNTEYFVGIGYDCHKLVKGKKLYLAGVEIDFDRRLKGHSDADVVLHSICDALLSAIGEKDIGEIFPDTEKKYKNISSKLIARKVLEKLKKKKFRIVNIDVVTICDQPKISKYKQRILNSLKEVFNTNCVNIKGKTTEGIKNFKDYIQCYSVVLVRYEDI